MKKVVRAIISEAYSSDVLKPFEQDLKKFLADLQ